MSSGGNVTSGRKMRLFVWDDINSSWVPVRGVKDATRNGTKGEEECTDFDSARITGSKSYLQGLRDVTWDITMNYLRGKDPGQEIIRNNDENGKQTLYRAYPLYSPLSTEDYYAGKFFPTSDTIPFPMEGPQEISMTLRASDELRQAQAGVSDQV